MACVGVLPEDLPTDTSDPVKHHQSLLLRLFSAAYEIQKLQDTAQAWLHLCVALHLSSLFLFFFLLQFDLLCILRFEDRTDLFVLTEEVQDGHAHWRDPCGGHRPKAAALPTFWRHHQHLGEEQRSREQATEMDIDLFALSSFSLFLIAMASNLRANDIGG